MVIEVFASSDPGRFAKAFLMFDHLQQQSLRDIYLLVGCHVGKTLHEIHFLELSLAVSFSCKTQDVPTSLCQSLRQGKSSWNISY